MNYATQTLASIVSNHYQTASLFEKFHLDFCCKGKQTLASACEQKGLDLSMVEQALEEIITGVKKQPLVFANMNAEQLIQYILTHHHFYIKQNLPQILTYLEKITMKHGDRFPNMQRVLTQFRELSFELLAHLEKEEKVLFPAIIAMEKGTKEMIPYLQIIRKMLTEHDDAGEMMEQIRILTLDYTTPENTCTTFQLTLMMLKDFESNLHKHVHLENNHLFPLTEKIVGEMADV
ncbi:iron-sulfur cluster repair di-iron protein [Sediminibacterium goheungense]|uniref:Regulator of cell morphogenesis and NO signaling n=1 Tax=Sediminibacterium goheungense TaxID=1086393 RepID=A0A4R6IX09_9BACT|nr:iron-sulfur cluster repair di-iron protein [Sediminibacterium goheungense]TDO26516.1 regulator of cell morphogenesis and NO signaling [Sediminibacterium goheungense]